MCDHLDGVYVVHSVATVQAYNMKQLSTNKGTKRSLLCIDLRWIDCSGVGTYIQGIMPGIVEQLTDISIVGLGNSDRLSSFQWAHASNVRLIDCRVERYSLAEQLRIPFLIPQNTRLFFSPYYTIPLLYNGPLAVTVHDLSHRSVPEITNNLKKRIYAQVMYRELRRKASVIFTVSHFSKAELLRLTSGTREDNITPTYLGVSDEWYGASLLPKLRSRPYFIHVGNIKPYKNLGRLVEAFLSIRDKLPHDLVIVGKSEGLITGESPEFFERVRRAGTRIHLTGVVSQQELLSLVGHADALIMPSLYEGFGLPPLEAMAAGIPALVARATSLPEVCGDAALYFDPFRKEDLAEKLLMIASDPHLRTQLRELGIEHSKRFTWSLCSRTTANILRANLGLSE